MPPPPADTAATPAVIDMHSHFFPRQWPDLEKRYGEPGWPWMRHEGAGKAMVMLGEAPFRPVEAVCWDVHKRIEDLERLGVDLQVISATPVLFAYQRKAAHAADCARLFNDAALELCSQGQGRLAALAQVPLQDIDAACREASRAMDSGFLGVQIGNHVGLKNLDDEGLLTFLQHCAALNAAVLVHPWDMMAPERMKKYMLAWLVGMAAETQLGLLSLILSGAFERLPASLRLCFAHGGGAFAYLLGRADNAWQRRELVRQDSPHPPSHYVERFYVDSAVFDVRSLQLLLDVMGEERVMLGTDYPFPLGEAEPGALIRQTPNLSPQTRQRLLGGNARRWLNLP